VLEIGDAMVRIGDVSGSPAAVIGFHPWLVAFVVLLGANMWSLPDQIDEGPARGGEARSRTASATGLSAQMAGRPGHVRAGK
jgi:hypothetical protein